MPDFTLYCNSTPNSYCCSAALEELDLDYDTVNVSLDKREHKTPEYLKINPNGKIPALVDHARGDFAVFESSAILFYLTKHYDKEHKISFDPATESDLYSEQIMWLFFLHGALGPIQGQATHFTRYAPVDLPYAKTRYITELKRVFSVLETRLNGRTFLVGERYSITDMKAFPWIRLGGWCDADVSATEYPKLMAWVARCEARPKTDKGLAVPHRLDPNALWKNEKTIIEYNRNWILADYLPAMDKAQIEFERPKRFDLDLEETIAYAEDR